MPDFNRSSQECVEAWIFSQINQQMKSVIRTVTSGKTRNKENDRWERKG